MGRNGVASMAALAIEVVWLRRESEVAGIVVCSRRGLEGELHGMIVVAEEEGCSIAAAVVEEGSKVVGHLDIAAAAGVGCCSIAGLVGCVVVVVVAVVEQYDRR